MCECATCLEVIVVNTCSTAARAYSNAHFGRGNAMATIWLDEVSCSGLEAQLLDCPAQPLGTHDCGHNEDAGVSCGTSQGTTNCTYILGHSPSIAFRHLTPNSARIGYATEGAFFSPRTCPPTLSEPPPPKKKEKKKGWVIIRLWQQYRKIISCNGFR